MLKKIHPFLIIVLSISGLQNCKMEHTLCRTDTLNKIPNKSKINSKNRVKTPPQKTLDYSKTITQQKVHIILVSITREMAAQQKNWKEHNERDKYTKKER